MTQRRKEWGMKSRNELDSIAIEIVNLLSKKDITISESSYVLEKCNSIIVNSTRVQRIKD